MILLSMVLALAIERVLSHLEGWREHALFERYVRWLHGVAGAGISEEGGPGQGSQLGRSGRVEE